MDAIANPAYFGEEVDFSQSEDVTFLSDDKSPEQVKPEAVIEALEKAEVDLTQFQNWEEERRHTTRAFHDSSKGTLKLQTVPMCGHKFRPGHEPKNRNCEPCWFTFFNAHGELTKACDEVHSQFGPDGLSQLRGPKFTKNFLKFMSTLAAWKKATEEAKQAEAGEPQPAEQSA